MKKSLIYHITPMGNWRENIKHLKKYMHVFFSGVRLAVVAQGAGLESFNSIRDELPLFDHIWPVENNPELRETPSLAFLLDALPHYDDTSEGMTFFAHTKGVTHTDNPAVTVWTRLLYEKNLGMVKDVERLISDHVMVGCFRRFGEFKLFPKGCSWHYSGTFFWFNNAELYARDWKNALKAERYGAEAFPGMLCTKEETACIFADLCGNPYKLSYLNSLL